MALSGVASTVLVPSNEALATIVVIWSRNWAKSAARAAYE
jgi:hypothetical protein